MQIGGLVLSDKVLHLIYWKVLGRVEIAENSEVVYLHHVLELLFFFEELVHM